MSRFIALGGTLAVALLLVGAGCAVPANQDGSDETNTTASGDASGEVEYSTHGDGVIELTATAVGTRQVKFEWELNDDDEPSHFILLRGNNADITHDQKTFWFRQHGSRRSATWINLPPGEQYFRICISNDKETCDTYSDALQVNVLSGPIRTSANTEEVSEEQEQTTENEEIMTEDDTAASEEESHTTTSTENNEEAGEMEHTESMSTSTEEESMESEDTGNDSTEVGTEVHTTTTVE